MVVITIKHRELTNKMNAICETCHCFGWDYNGSVYPQGTIILSQVTVYGVTSKEAAAQVADLFRFEIAENASFERTNLTLAIRFTE